MDTGGGRLVDIERCEIVDETINRSFQDFRKKLIADKTNVRGERQIIWSGFSGKEKTAGTPEYVTRMVKDKSLIAPYGGFFQANLFLVDSLVDCVMEMSGLTGLETVLDCYCGSGLFSLFLASHVQQIFGIEIDGESAKCARMNYENYGVSNATVFRGDITNILKEKFIGGEIDIDVVVLDPPRIGCDKSVLSNIVELKPEKIIYISCNPATQARDIGYLSDKDFSLRTLQPIDMFPHTKHIEVIALMEVN